MAEPEGGSPWFWKIFGGTILGAITFLLVAHINQINSSIERVKNESAISHQDLRGDIKENRVSIDTHKERLLSLEQSGVKDKLDNIETSLKSLGEIVSTNSIFANKVDAIEIIFKDLKEAVSTNALELINLKEKVTNNEAVLKSVSELLTARNEKIAVLDSFATAIESSINSLKEEIKLVRQEREKLADSLRQEREKLADSLRVDDGKLSEQIQILRDRIAILESRIPPASPVVPAPT